MGVSNEAHWFFICDRCGQKEVMVSQELMNEPGPPENWRWAFLSKARRVTTAPAKFLLCDLCTEDMFRWVQSREARR